MPVDTSRDPLHERGCRCHQRRATRAVTFAPACALVSGFRFGFLLGKKFLDRSLGLTVALRGSWWNGGVDCEFVTGEVP